MGNFAQDTAVEGGDGRYTAVLAPSWASWGPNGGYLSVVLLRAAGLHSKFDRVASMAIHFLSVGKFDAVQISTRSLRVSRRAESVRVTMLQQENVLAEALVWLVADRLDGLSHSFDSMPTVASPDQLQSWKDLPGDRGGWLPFWDNFDYRPTIWFDDPGSGKPLEARWHGWYRYQPRSTFEDSVLSDARSLVLLDTMGYSAAVRAHLGPIKYIAPNLDLSVQFHQTDPRSQWLFAEGFSTIAENGLVFFQSSVRSESGRRLASGSGQLLCREISRITR
ncbi:thioesterase family protein [Saccharopolyspora shandongensis]|uniref:thioesterase family protein n=1 Tax=Saccharopolyspora shandongensis TaxID=418495 RepID=UPI0034039BB7